jgi:glutaredoxin 2
MFKLYHYEICPFCVRVRMMLEACGFEYTMQVLPYDDKETTQRLVGTNLTPILTIEEGKHMPESLDIVRYLVETSGFNLDGRKLPKAIRSALGKINMERTKLVKSRFLRLDLEEFATDSAKAYFYNRWDMTPESVEQELAKTDEYIQKVQPQLKVIGDALESEHYVYDGMAMADIELFPPMRTLTCVKGLVFPDKLKKYLDYHLQQSKVAALTAI